MDGIETWAWSLIFMIEPLPNCRSIWLSAASSACSRVSRHGVNLLDGTDCEDLVLRPGRPQH